MDVEKKEARIGSSDASAPKSDRRAVEGSRSDAPSRSGCCASGGLAIRYVEWGRADAPPLLLIHGGYDHARSWDRIASALSGRYRVIVPDARGHGNSDWSAEGHYGLLDHVEDQVRLLDHLRLNAVILVGHSYGGRVCLRHAGIYPERIERLVVLEGLGPRREDRAQWRATPVGRRIRDHHERQRALSAKPPRGFASLDACAARYTERNRHLNPDLAWHLAFHGTRIGADGLLYWKFDPRIGLIHPLDVTHEDELQLFSATTPPTLLIHGDNSTSARPEGDPRVEAMPDCRTVRVPGAGHWIHHDRPEAILLAIDAFLPKPPNRAAAYSLK